MFDIDVRELLLPCPVGMIRPHETSHGSEELPLRTLRLELCGALQGQRLPRLLSWGQPFAGCHQHLECRLIPRHLDHHTVDTTQQPCRVRG